MPAALTVAWQDAQKDSPYRLAPACGSAVASAGGALAVSGARAPETGVLCDTRNAEMSLASASLSWKFGIVAVVA